MKKLWLAAACLVSILLVTACNTTTTTPSEVTSTRTTPVSSSTTTVTVNAPPDFFKVVSLTGPLPSNTPGGPEVEIVLMNLSDQPFIALIAILGVDGAPRLYYFDFDLTEENPLAPGESIVSQMVLVGGRFSYNVSYPLTVGATFPGGGGFSSIVQVRFSPPPGASTTTTDLRPVTTTPGQEPVEIVSLIGPIPPYNPGGPVVQVALKNISSQSIIALAAGFNNVQFGTGFTFNFDITSENPLPPGETAIGRWILIGPGHGDELTVSGTLQDGSAFSFTMQVQLSPPPE